MKLRTEEEDMNVLGRFFYSAFLLSVLFSAAFSQGASGVVEIVNLYDAFGKERGGVVQDWGFSALIRYRGKTVLFDAGTNSLKLERNVKALGVDLSKVDVAIVSHSHYDHIGGFDFLLEKNPKVKIYLPNDFIGLGAPTKFPFRERDPAAAEKLSKDDLYFRGGQSTDGFPVISTGRFWKSDVEFLTAAKEVLPGLTLVPTTSTLTGTFNRYPPFEQNPNLNGLPELSAVFATKDGDIVISGCSHSGIENIVKASKKTDVKTRLVVGGFHLITYDEAYIDSLASKMRLELGVVSVAPAHCTGHLGFSVLKEAFGVNYKYFGLGEKIELSEL
jgi:7,8-dihydropterin-6-yl-methyl-4-(beta-D-ribofuranosyl)aminobenzene 5'-phosphate synthase